MSVYKQPKSKYWWYKFTWNGEPVRESTKQTNKRVAEQIEAARRTELAKGEVGIKKLDRVPTLAEFAERDFLPFVRSTSAGKPKTVQFYENTTSNLLAFEPLAKLPLNQINSDLISSFIAQRRSCKGQKGNVEVSTINRDLAALRRMFHLAQEWGKTFTILPRVKLLPDENHRERVLSEDEENRYLDAADPLLREVGTVLIDTALRPEECFRLRWENFREGLIEIHKGKRKGSRRRVPASERVISALENRKAQSAAEWIFPAPTESGHIESSSIKKQHAKALKASKVPPFVLYSLRHTCLTRWAKYMDPYTLHVVAGHADMNTTKRYVHPNEADIRTGN